MAVDLSAARSLTDEDVASAAQLIEETQRRHFAAFPGESDDRQPVHTVYGGAHLFTARTAERLGSSARSALQRYAPEPTSLARVFDWQDASLSERIYTRVTRKLDREPVEDFRVDFEDGYGSRPDDEEDADAARVAQELAAGMKDGSLPPFVGIRIKPLTRELYARSLRTLDLVVSRLARAGGLPGNFVVTLPKVVAPADVRALVQIFEALERRLSLPTRSLRMEIMVETTQAVISPGGSLGLPDIVEAADGRCVGAHLGIYDYTAACNITAQHQHMMHPACEFARQVMQVSLAQRGIAMSDGATNVIPVGPHRAAEGATLTATQSEQNTRAVHDAWRLSYAHIRNSLEQGFYQGWDLHPAQLPVRYAAVYSFFLEGLEQAQARLSGFIQRAAQATLLGDVFDDAATGQGLLNYFLRAINCGAIDEVEATHTGLTVDEIRSRSFVEILQTRRANA